MAAGRPPSAPDPQAPELNRAQIATSRVPASLLMPTSVCPGTDIGRIEPGRGPVRCAAGCGYRVPMHAPPRWVTETSPGHSEWYIERFRKMAAAGMDLAGEARLVDAMLPRGSRILDAGCGPGRVAAELDARGHDVVGVDVDAKLIAAAGQDHPGPDWITADLADLDLPALGRPDPFDAIVVAGNVMTFLAIGTESLVLQRLGAHLADEGFIIVGFGTNRGYAIADFDRDLATAGLRVESRFATWELRPWRDEISDFAVTVAVRIDSTR